MRAFEFLIEAPTPAPQVIQAQTQIADKVKDIFDLDELNQIYSYVRKMDLGGGFENIFAKDVDLRQIQTTLSKAIVDVKAPFDQKMAFAKEIVGTGIIDVESLLTPGVTRTITDLINTEYPEIYQGIAADLMNIAGAYKSGKTKTNRGKGEFFLAILSPQIMLSKEGHGDLTINGQGYEVKDNQARIKGRKGYGSVDQAKAAVTKDVNKFVDQQVSKNPDSPLAGKTFSVGVGAQQNFWTEFGPLAIQGGADAKAVTKFVKDQWAKMIKSLYLNITKEQLSSISPFDEQGLLNFKAIHASMKALAFDYYKAADGFNGVLFVNSKKMSITYVDTAEQFISLIGVVKYGFETGAQNGMQVSTP